MYHKKEGKEERGGRELEEIWQPVNMLISTLMRTKRV